MMKRPERIPIYNGYFVEEYCVEEIFDASMFYKNIKIILNIFKNIIKKFYFLGLIMPSITATILPFSQLGRIHRNQPQYSKQHHRNCSRIRNLPKNPFTKNSSKKDETLYGIERYERKLPKVLEEEYLLRRNEEKKKNETLKKNNIYGKFNKKSTEFMNKQKRLSIRASEDILSGR